MQQNVIRILNCSTIRFDVLGSGLFSTAWKQTCWHGVHGIHAISKLPVPASLLQQSAQIGASEQTTYARRGKEAVSPDGQKYYW